MKKRPPLWVCDVCSRPFANRNQSHACETSGVVALDEHFEGKSDRTRRLYDLYLEAVRACGPVTISSSKTRIAIQVRMIFSAVMPRKDFLRGHLVLARRVEDRRFVRVDSISPKNHVHVFELREEKQLDPRFRKLIAESYEVGCQKHLDR